MKKLPLSAYVICFFAFLISLLIIDPLCWIIKTVKRPTLSFWVGLVISITTFIIWFNIFKALF